MNGKGRGSFKLGEVWTGIFLKMRIFFFFPAFLESWREEKSFLLLLSFTPELEFGWKELKKQMGIGEEGDPGARLSFPNSRRSQFASCIVWGGAGSRKRPVVTPGGSWEFSLEFPGDGRGLAFPGKQRRKVELLGLKFQLPWPGMQGLL